MKKRASGLGPRASARVSDPDLAEDRGPRTEDLLDAGSREHYQDPLLYDYEYRRRRVDIRFYRELANKRGSGRILDLGAGSGRLAIQLARDGHEVVAVDHSPEMLGRLRDRIAKLPKAAARRITIVEGDLRRFHIDGKVALAIAAFNVIEHLYSDADVDRCFRRVRQCLEPGGAFAFDVQLPDLLWLERDPTKRWSRTRYTDPHTRRAMIYSTNHDWDPDTRISNIRLYYEPVDGHGPTKVVKLSQRKFFPSHLEALIAHAGLRMIARYGDWAWQPLALIGEDAPPVDGKVPESQVLVVIPDEKITFSDEDLGPGRSSTRKK